MKKFYNYILLLPLLTPFYSSAVTEIWNGSLITTSFINTNIQIDGDTILASGTTTVSALSQDVTILVNNDAHVFSNDGGQSTLILEVAYPWTITVHIQNDLTFGGVENNLNLPLIILEQGDGTIKWIIEDDTTLVYGSSETRGGTLLTIYFNGTTLPEHTFEVHGDGKIQFKRHSKIGYRIINGTTTFTQYAIFDAVNPDDDHNTLVKYADGATVLGYTRRLLES
ncbi:MAG TPA: hypothetical protein VL201_00195 [Patescibacteria group bacterium]|jgi:hypothetical protein|nr:hypothetical protein [Patescibacteria group bacterium]